MFRLAPFSSSPFVILNPANVSMLHILLEHIWGVITLDKQIFSGLYNFAWNKALAVLGNSDIRLTRYVNTRNVIIAHRQTGRSYRCAHIGEILDAGNQEKRRKLGFQLNWKLDPGNREKRDAKRKCLPLWGKTQYPSPAYVKPSVQKFTRFVLLRTRVSWILNF